MIEKWFQLLDFWVNNLNVNNVYIEQILVFAPVPNYRLVLVDLSIKTILTIILPFCMMARIRRTLGYMASSKVKDFTFKLM